jgi:hypothetical protein
MEWWVSDTSACWVFDGAGDSPGGWTNFDQWNLPSDGIVANVSFAGLEFGVMLRGLFTGTRAAVASHNDIAEDVFDYAVFGLKFNMDPVEFAAQFNVDDLKAYFGMRWFAGPITLGLNFDGKLGVENVDDVQYARFGAGIDFNGGVFTAGLRAAYMVDMITDAWAAGVVPSFTFNVLPDNLLFRMYARLLFTEDDFDYGFAPALFWNFKGTGAGSWDTGIGIGYRFGTIGAWSGHIPPPVPKIPAPDSASYNEVNVVFRWAL